MSRLGNTNAKGNKGKPKSEEHKRKIGLSHKGKTKSEEHKRKLSNAKLGKPMSEEAKHNMSIAKLGNTNGRGHKGKPKSEETKAKMSKAQLGNTKGSANKGRTFSEEHKSNISKAAAKRVLDGNINGYKTSKPHPYTTKDGRYIILRNSWEYKVVVYIDTVLTQYTWYYEQAALFYNGRSYLPDFFLYDIEGELVKIIEVKGDFKETAKAKFYMFKEYLESCLVEVELWDEKRLKELNIL